MLYNYKTLIIIFMLSLISCNESQHKKDNNRENKVNTFKHPNVALTVKGVQEIRKQLGKAPLFDETLAKTKEEVDKAIIKGINVPIPKDMAGGYTHTQHKKNYVMMHKAGMLFQILNDDTYAIYIKDMLMKYAELYPNLQRHPQERSYARGKIFWQCLNDANWLVYTSQAYDCIYGWLSKEDRDFLEKNLFKPFADFLSVETPQFFNRIHNHSTWGCVAVGMIGLVMDDEVLVNRALYGIENDGIATDAKDNDGGFIKNKEGKSGFLANLDSPFSPDGYYTEGPYYQRYAMYPFLIFAQALQNKKPELDIFKYKDGVLIKSVDAIINLSDEDGEFFPLNDGQKGMSYHTESLVSAVDIAYFYGDQDRKLLSIAKAQNKVQLDEAGMAVATAIYNDQELPFEKKSIELRDGAKGDKGGVGILRTSINDQKLTLVMKYSAHGLSHGHFDKLSFSFYENGEEVIQDYGLVRYVNVEQKNGGGYLKENKTWAKQTIAHNTIAINEESQYKGKYKESSKHHSDKYFFNVSNPKFQIVSAKENNAYKGTKMHRTMALVSDEDLAKPFIIDVYRVNSDQKHKYDLPYYYFGQYISSTIDFKKFTSLSPLGDSNGYQHLWKEAQGKSKEQFSQFTWLHHKTFYSLSSANTSNDTFILGSIGANDPSFNLRNDPVIIQRKENTSTVLYVNILESHGIYNPVTEAALNSYSEIKNIEVLLDTEEYTSVEIHFKNGTKKVFIVSNQNASDIANHKLNINNTDYQWSGPYYFNN